MACGESIWIECRLRYLGICACCLDLYVYGFGFRVQMYEINLVLAQHLFFIELSLSVSLFLLSLCQTFAWMNESSKLFLFFFCIKVHGTHTFSYRKWKDRKINKYINTFCSRLQTNPFSHIYSHNSSKLMNCSSLTDQMSKVMNFFSVRTPNIRINIIPN